MGTAATQAKKRWNNKKYTQVKVSIDPKLASAFKETCASSGISMAKKLSQFMSEYTNTSKKIGRSPDYATKRKRRAALKTIVAQLERIKAAEEQSRDAIPENLQGSEIYENSDECVSSLDDAIELLIAIY